MREATTTGELEAARAAAVRMEAELVDIYFDRATRPSGDIHHLFLPDWTPLPGREHFGYMFQAAHRMLRASRTAARGDGLRVRARSLIERALARGCVRGDGFAVSRQAGAAMASGDDSNELLTLPLAQTDSGAYKRKNCRAADAATMLLPCALRGPNGVDLNRAYSAYWGGPGSSSDSTTQQYRGPAPFTEPEAQAMFDVLTSANRFALIHRVESMKRADSRARKITEMVEMLARGETLYPQKGGVHDPDQHATCEAVPRRFGSKG